MNSKESLRGIPRATKRIVRQHAFSSVLLVSSGMLATYASEEIIKAETTAPPTSAEVANYDTYIGLNNALFQLTSLPNQSENTVDAKDLLEEEFKGLDHNSAFRVHNTQQKIDNARLNASSAAALSVLLFGGTSMVFVSELARHKKRRNF